MRQDSERQKLPFNELLSRRNVLRSAIASALALSACGCVTINDEERQRRARAIAFLDATLSVDMHSHAGGINKDDTTNKNVAASMKQGRLAAACFAVSSDRPVLARGKSKIFAEREPRPGELQAHVLNRFEIADAIVARGGMVRANTLGDLRIAKTNGVPAMILAVEGSDSLDGKIENLEVAHQRGVRHWQLVHYRADNGLGDIQTEDPRYNGVTPFGLDVVRECNRLGMIVDVAHATLATVRQIASAATAPLILSHTSLTPTPKKHSRQISVEHAKLVADTGGVVGVWANGNFFKSFAAYAEGIARLAEVVGVDHAGIGTDLEGMPTPLFSYYGDFPDLVVQLFKYFNEDEITKNIGANYLRVFGEVARQ
jgi:membrane dipeptidase